MTALSIVTLAAKAKSYPNTAAVGRRECKMAEAVQAYAMPLGSIASTAVQVALSAGPFGASAGNTGEIRFLELAANGSNYVGFKAPDSISANKVWVLPSADGTNGQCIVTNGSGVLSFSTPVVAGTGGTLTGNLLLDNQKEVRFLEADAGGDNYVGLKAAAALSGDITYTLPASAPGADGRNLTSTTAGVMSWSSFHIFNSQIATLTGGSTTEDITIASVAATDVVIATLHTGTGSATQILKAVTATGKVTVTANGNFAASDKVNILVIRP